MFYGSYSRGYKGGGANPPGVIPDASRHFASNSPSNETHPLTFAPEFVNAYELGTKNTLLDGAMTLNGDVFYYDYKNYQISQIVDRTAVNLNFNATVKGAEMEATWEPIAGLRFNFAGGYEDTRVGNGQKADRPHGPHGRQSRLDGGQALRHADIELHSSHRRRQSAALEVPGGKWRRQLARRLAVIRADPEQFQFRQRCLYIDIRMF